MHKKTLLKYINKYLLIFFLLSTALLSQAQTDKKIFTKADYDSAVSKLNFSRVNKVLSSMSPNAMWQADGRIEYRTPSGRDTQYLVGNSVLKGIDQTKSNTFFGSVDMSSKSPDGTKAVFIRDWNLWVKDFKTNTDIQLTKDGIKDFGYATDNAGWTHSERPIVLWSPDSKKIATFQQDQRHVSNMYLVRTKVGAPKLVQWKYPLPGDSINIKIQRVIINVATGNTVRLKMLPDERKGTLSDDIAASGKFDDNEWSADGKQLAFVSVSRDHKIARFRVADAETGMIREVFEEKVPTQYESGQSKISWKFLPETNEVIWYSERDNWGHLYLYNLITGKLKQQITKGNFVVTQILRVDTEKRQLIFEAKGKEAGENPYFSHFYKIDFSGKKLIALTTEPGDHNISFSPDYKYFIDKYSTPVIAPVTKLKDVSGKTISILGKIRVEEILNAGWSAPEVFSVKSANKLFDLYGMMYKPSHFDKNKKYPVVVYIYPGPQGGSIRNWSFSISGNGSDNQALAELGFIVVALEGSGNPNRSKAFHDACYGNMAENTLPDQIAGLQQLAVKNTFMDLNRVGIWGHSGGGFATAAALFKYPDFFKVGIAESGNHDNRNYEDDWGERYIGLLDKDNYENQANPLYAKNLKGKLLIVHGAMDDNVPPSNSYLVVDALIKANKDFDLLIFPNDNHGYIDRFYMMRRRWDYFVKNLLGATPPQDYRIILN